MGQSSNWHDGIWNHPESVWKPVDKVNMDDSYADCTTMMFQPKAVAFSTATLSTLVLCSLTTASAHAGTLFSQREVDQTRFVAVASPYGGNAHQLLIIEQASNVRPCWSEQGARPTLVNPLLADFDFTNICGRSTDSNGYSIRMAGEDLGWKYSLRMVYRNGDIVLVGVPNVSRSQPELQIGRAGGFTNGFAKINLNPGWRMAQRVYNGQPVGHVYLTTDRPLTSMVASGAIPSPTPVVSPRPAVTLPRPTVTPIPVPRPSTSVPSTSSSIVGSTVVNPVRRSVPIPVPLPEVRSTARPTPQPPVASVPIPVPLPESVRTAEAGMPATAQPATPPNRAIAPGDYVVPTVEVYK